MEMDKDYAKKLWEEGKEFREIVLLAILKEKPMSTAGFAVYFTDKISNNTAFRGPLEKLRKNSYVIREEEGRNKPYKITNKGIKHLDEYKDLLTQFSGYL